MKGRDPDPGMSVAPMYEPPEKMGPAEVGTLIDGSVDPRDITAVIGRYGGARLREDRGRRSTRAFFSTKDYEFHLLKDPSQWNDLTDYERAMLQQVFAGGQVTLLSEPAQSFLHGAAR